MIATLIRRGLDYERRWDEIEATVGSVSDTGHDWDRDPAAWVRAERRSDPNRSGWACRDCCLTRPCWLTRFGVNRQPRDSAGYGALA